MQFCSSQNLATLDVITLFEKCRIISDGSLLQFFKLYSVKGFKESTVATENIVAD